MVFTNIGRERMAYNLGSNINNYISYFNVGTGSGTALVTNDELITEWSRFEQTGNPNFDTRKVTFTGDLGTLGASGLTLMEFGLIVSGPALTGSNWLREAVGSIVFDGTNELKIEAAIEILTG